MTSEVNWSSEKTLVSTVQTIWSCLLSWTISSLRVRLHWRHLNLPQAIGYFTYWLMPDINMSGWHFVSFFSTVNLRPGVVNINVSALGRPWFSLWLVACSAPSHYLNQCWFVINLAITYKLEWNLKESTNISFKKMHLKMSSAKCQPFLFWPHCIKVCALSDIKQSWLYRDFLGRNKSWVCTYYCEVFVVLYLSMNTMEEEKYSIIYCTWNQHWMCWPGIPRHTGPR